MAEYVVETVGTQEYTITGSEFVKHVEMSYGVDAAAAVAPNLI